MATDRQAPRCAKCLKTIRKGQSATTLSFCTYSGRRDGEFIMATWLTIIAHVACMGSLTPETWAAWCRAAVRAGGTYKRAAPDEVRRELRRRLEERAGG